MESTFCRITRVHHNWKIACKYKSQKHGIVAETERNYESTKWTDQGKEIVRF